MVTRGAAAALPLPLLMSLMRSGARQGDGAYVSCAAALIKIDYR